MTKKMQQNLIIAAILTAAAVFVYFNYIVSPLNAKYKERFTKLQQVETKLADTKRKALELPKLEAEMKALEQEVSSLEKLLPKDKEVPTLLRIITRTAQKYQLKVTNINPGAVVSQANYNEVPFQMTIQGTYHAVAYFLNDIGQESRILSVKNINFAASPSTDKESQRSITINCTFLAYTFKG